MTSRSARMNTRNVAMDWATTFLGYLAAGLVFFALMRVVGLF